MLTKKQAQSVHFRRRFGQRIGGTISKKERRAILLKIQSGKAEFIKRYSLRVKSWKFNIGGVDCEVLYDNKRKSLITVWPI